jgi:major membrane immunogen (membrane-anchored lipoprotein)
MRILLYIILHTFLILTSCKERDVKRLYFDNGKLQCEYETKKGKKDGFSRFYFENGNVEYEGDYKNDLRHGWHVLYHSNGKINQKTLYVNINGKEMATRKLKYSKNGELVSDFTFAQKRISLRVTKKGPYHVGDTLSAKMRIENAKYNYSEATVGFFDEYLNVLRYRKEDPIYYHGNENHEIVMRLLLTKPGPDTITWLVRDFYYLKKTDSTGISIGEESYFGYFIQVEEVKNL